jgi:lysophospholipase L1-like esterase
MKRIILIITFIVAVVNTGFSQNSLIEKSNSKDFYNLNNNKIIHNIGKFNVLVQNDKIIFDETHGRIETPLKYNNLYNEFNFNNIYEIKDILGNKYFFRFGWVSFNDEKSMFTGVIWIDDNIPKLNNIYTEFDFSVVDIKYVQFGSTSLCTIGDSQTWFSRAQNLRKFINEANDELIFVGSNTDIYGYGHEGEGGDKTIQLLNRINNIPRTDYYTLLIGTNDYWYDLETARVNILKVVSYLSNFNPKAKIFYLSPLPTTNEVRDNFNTNLYKKLIDDFSKMKNVIVLDVGEKMRQNKNWASAYITSDGVHPSDEGVRFMANLIANKIK